MTFVQRFNSSLDCFVHFHVLVPDGVFTRTEGDGSVVFREGPAPTRAEIASVAARVAHFRAASKGPWVAEASEFNVHAGVMARAGDREGLERLCRYGARPK